MNKIFLSKTFGLIVLCFSLSSVATTLITKERICPLGGERFTVDVLGSYSTFGQRLDLKTLGTYEKYSTVAKVLYEAHELDNY